MTSVYRNVDIFNLYKLMEFFLQTHSASTVAADSSLCSHTFPSIDNKDLMLSCDLIFGLDGMLKLQYAKTKIKNICLGHNEQDVLTAISG